MNRLFCVCGRLQNQTLLLNQFAWTISLLLPPHFCLSACILLQPRSLSLCLSMVVVGYSPARDKIALWTIIIVT